MHKKSKWDDFFKKMYAQAKHIKFYVKKNNKNK